MTGLTITAPFAGWAAPLEEVPDPVFAGRMMGDGVAIHPVEGLLRAPCDGTVITLHAARHAVTIRSPEGAEILIHIGLETVALGGEGFLLRLHLRACVGERFGLVGDAGPLLFNRPERLSERPTAALEPFSGTLAHARGQTHPLRQGDRGTNLSGGEGVAGRQR